MSLLEFFVSDCGFRVDRGKNLEEKTGVVFTDHSSSDLLHLDFKEKIEEIEEIALCVLSMCQIFIIKF